MRIRREVKMFLVIILVGFISYMIARNVKPGSAISSCSELAPPVSFNDSMVSSGLRDVRWTRGYYAVLRDGTEVFRVVVNCGGDGLTYRLSADGNIEVNFKEISYSIPVTSVPPEAMAILKAGRDFFSPDPATGVVSAGKFDRRCRVSEPIHLIIGSGFVSWHAGSYQRTYQSITVWVAPECGGSDLDYRFDRATKVITVVGPEGWFREINRQDLPAMVLKIMAAGDSYFQ